MPVNWSPRCSACGRSTITRCEVEFEEPCAYFLGLTAYITYRPIREDVYRRFGERYAAEAGNLRSNGPFRLSEWVHGARLRLERNPQYWNVAAVALNAINVPYITEEPSSTFNLFKDDKIALAPLDDSTMREALARRMNVKRFIDGAQLYIEFNHRPGRPTRNRHLRKALQLAFDPDTFVARIVRVPGNEPMRSLLPGWIQGEKELFRHEHPPRALHTDVAAGAPSAGTGQAGTRRDPRAGAAARRHADGRQAGRVPAGPVPAHARHRTETRQAGVQAAAGENDCRRFRHGRFGMGPRL